MHHFVRIYIATLLCCCLCSCKEDTLPSKSIEEQSLENKRKLQLQNLAEFGITPLMDEMVRSSIQLEEEILLLIDAPDPMRLQSARDSWLELSKQMRVHDVINRAELVIYELFSPQGRIENIEGVLQGSTEPLTNDIFEEAPAMGIIEYLIFDESNYDALSLLKAFERRRELLQLAGTFVQRSAKLAETLWRIKNDNFTTSVKIEGEKFSVYTRIGNYLYSFLRERAEMIARPLGLLGASGAVREEQLEAYRSETSRELFVSGFEAFKNVFYGDFEESPSEYGFDDYLKELNREDVLEKITLKIQEIDTSLTELGVFEQELVSRPGNLRELKEQLDALFVLFTVDFQSATQIPYHEPCCDGD